MADELEEVRTFKQKALFYTTAFFVLLGTFSLFAFLFLVPFVIDPAFNTIFMQFETRSVNCVTVETEYRRGARNCSWTSCREGCTKEVYECTQIRVNYKFKDSDNATAADFERYANDTQAYQRMERSIRDEYDYLESAAMSVAGIDGNEDTLLDDTMLSLTNNSDWLFTGARLFPNVKGCGYPPILNCTIWNNRYRHPGQNFSCFYSKVDPGLVIDTLDMWQNTLNLVYAIAIPIPSFIISVIYLTFAYFKIYNEDEESAPLDKNAEDIAGDDEEEGGEVEQRDERGECEGAGDTEAILPNGVTQIHTSSNPLTPNTDLTSFGHQLKVKMADEMSRESLEGGLISNSASLQGNLSKTMTTSISTPPGPIAAI